MNHFKRAFGLTLAVIILLFFLVFSFELINKTLAKSGFSSGEVLLLEFEEKVFSGEILGQKFSADLSPVFELINSNSASLNASPNSSFVYLSLIYIS